MKFVRTAVLAGFLAVLASAAQATPLPAEGLSPQELALILNEQGYRVAVKTGEDGPAYIESTTGNGVNFFVYFFDCTTRCASIQISAPWTTAAGPPTLEEVNDFNTSFRWLKANVDDGETLWAAMDVTLGPGVTTEAIADHFLLWEACIESFKTYFAPVLPWSGRVADRGEGAPGLVQV